MWDLISLTKSKTCAPYIGHMQFSPLDHQGIPSISNLAVESKVHNAKENSELFI